MKNNLIILFRKLRNKYYLFLYLFFSKNVECLICGWKGYKFIPINCGNKIIYENYLCPNCDSHPRHRLLYLYLKKKLNSRKNFELLHFSPQKCLKDYISNFSNINYLSSDFKIGKEMVDENIEKLTFKNNSFDVILCIHILEHINNDKKAISELYRILKPDGFAIIDVPINYNLKKTYENTNIILPEDRAIAFGQSDHIRLYGNDFKFLLRKEKFKVKIVHFYKNFNSKEIIYYGFEKNPIYYCTK